MLNKELDDFRNQMIVYYPTFYKAFNQGDINYDNLGNVKSSKNEIKRLFQERVENYFNSLSEKIDKEAGGLDILNNREREFAREIQIKNIMEAIKNLREFTARYNLLRDKVKNRVVIFKNLAKSYNRAKNIKYTSDGVIKQTNEVILKFDDGAYQLQNSSMESLNMNIIFK